LSEDAVLKATDLADFEDLIDAELPSADFVDFVDFVDFILFVSSSSSLVS
jgi:hypothetical protein